MKIMGVEFAPLTIPLRRRLQTLAVLNFTYSFLFLGFGCLFLSIYLLFTRFYYVPLLYGVWYFVDWNHSSRGGRRWQWVRTWSLWKYFVDYFPLKLIKTADLSPEKNYIMACHPHGIMCNSHFINFSTEGSGFSQIFPGLRPYLLTLDGQFKFPFFRDYFMLTGACSANKESMQYLLTNKGKGNALGLAIGGPPEALNAAPGNFNLILKDKKGFCKIALQYGADLCPVYSFGENDLYHQVPNPEGSRLRQFQLMLMRICGFSPPFFHGRGVFNYTFGLLPFRSPINTVVGKPIEVTQNENPTREDVEALHAKYIQALTELFEEHKTKFGLKEDDHLSFV